MTNLKTNKQELDGHEPTGQDRRTRRSAEQAQNSGTAKLWSLTQERGGLRRAAENPESRRASLASHSGESIQWALSDAIPLRSLRSRPLPDAFALIEQGRKSVGQRNETDRLKRTGNGETTFAWQGASLLGGCVAFGRAEPRTPSARCTAHSAPGAARPLHSRTAHPFSLRQRCGRFPSPFRFGRSVQSPLPEAFAFARAHV